MIDRQSGQRPDATIPDAKPGNWIERYAPSWLRPYARLARWDRPIGWWLLLLPCWWSATLASDSLGRSWPDFLNLLLFLIGAIAMRGAGCTYNDIVDRDLDASVARTRNRPIPSGDVSPVRAAVFLVIQALTGLAVLLQFNSLTIWIGLGSLGAVALYPFLKRVTDWPQIGLGLAFSWGALVGWTAEAGSFDLAALLLYAGGVLWTIGYDTIYAIQDIEDDALIGIRSTARLFGENVGKAVAGFYAGALGLFLAAFIVAGASWIAYAGLALGALNLVWQARIAGRVEGRAALHLFRSNRSFGLVLFAGLLLDGWATGL